MKYKQINYKKNYKNIHYIYLLILITILIATITILVNADPVINLSHSGEQTILTNLLLTLDSNTSNSSIIDWRINSTSFTVLNLPFESIQSNYVNSTFNNTFIKDYSTYNLTGIVFNPISAVGFDQRKALSFNQNSIFGKSYISIADSDHLDAGNRNWTMEAWIKANTSQSSYIISKRKSSGYYDQWGIGIFDGTLSYKSGKKLVCMFGLSNNNFHDVSTLADITDDKWHHVVCRIRYGQAVDMFIDGVPAATKVIRNQAWTPVITSVPVLIGSSDKSSIEKGYYFNGSIDEIKIYPRALSSEQIINNYEQKAVIINNKELKIGELWNALITVNDGVNDISTKMSNSILITDAIIGEGNSSINNSINNSTNISTPILNSNYFSENNTIANITLSYAGYIIDMVDLNSSNINSSIIDWRINNTSLAVLNLPLESIESSYVNISFNNTYVKDYSTYGSMYGIRGTIFNAIQSQGYNGKKALNFNQNLISGKSYISIADSDHLDAGNKNWTMEAWIKANTSQSSYIISKRKSSGYYDQWGIGIFDGTLSYKSGKKLVCMFGLSNNNFHDVSTLADIADDKWHHVVCRIRYGQAVDIFIDGASALTKIIRNQAWTPVITSMPVLIGAADKSSVEKGYYFNGSIDEIRMYSRALTAEQIKNNYEQKIRVINNQEFKFGDVWNAEVIINDGVNDIITKMSNSILITNAIVGEGNNSINNSINNLTNISIPVLNITYYPENNQISGIALYYSFNSTVSKNIIDWRINNTSFAVLNLPLESILSTYVNISFNNTYVKDYSTYNLLGTVFNPIVRGGYDGKKALDFNQNAVSEKNYISIADSDNLDAGNKNWTIEAWIKAAPIPQNSYIISKRKTSGNYDQWGIGIFDGTLNYKSGRKLVCMFGLSNSSFHDVSTIVDITDDKWHHVVCRIKYGETLDIFIDGLSVPVKVIRNQSWAPVITSVPLLIGSSDKSYYFIGAIDDIKVYSRALTEWQIKDNYDQKGTIINNQEFKLGELWNAAATINDGVNDISTKISNTLIINSDFLYNVSNNIIDINQTNKSMVLIASDYPFNTTNSKLILNNIVQNSSIKKIINWKLNASSITLLHTPFEAGTNNSFTLDYSDGNNSILASSGNAHFNSTGGYDGKGAFDFDGNGDFVTYPNNKSLELINNFTITAWVKRDVYTSWDGFVSKFSTNHSGWAIVYDNPLGRYAALVGCNNNYELIESNPNIATYYDLNWYYVSLRVNNGLVNFYINGIKQGDSSTQKICDNGQSITLGKYYTDLNNHYLQGKVDDLIIWNRPLSDEQILALFKNQTNIIVANETSPGDNWLATITLNDGITAGKTIESNSVSIVRRTITAPIIESVNLRLHNYWIKNNQSLILNITKCTDEDNNDNDPLIYNWYVDNSLKANTQAFVFNGTDYNEGQRYIVGYCKDNNLLFDIVNFTIEVLGNDDFSIIVPSNVQRQVELYPWIATAVTNWAVEMKNYLNIQFIPYVGDLVNNGGSIQQYNYLNKSLTILDGFLPYTNSIGNHDYDANLVTNNLGDRSITNWDRYFPLNKYKSLSWFGGQKSDSTYINNYAFFNENGNEFMILNLEFCPSDEVLLWANETIKNFPNKNVIMVTHENLNYDNYLVNSTHEFNCDYFLNSSFALSQKNNGVNISNKFTIYHKNIFMTISGHVLGDGEGFILENGVYGNVINHLFHNSYSNYAGTVDSNALVRIYIFKPSNNSVQVRDYDPYYDSFKTEGYNQFSFNISLI